MTQIVILAAGKGNRMKDELPKVLIPLKNKPIIEYLMNSIFSAGVDFKPVVVVSSDNQSLIRKALEKYDVEYALQNEQLGTGHALNCAREKISSKADRVMVLYGDHPFIKSSSIEKFATANGSVMTVMPTKVVDFEDWRCNFYHWGRFVRNDNQDITEIIEFKDATDKVKLLTEVNPGFLCFDKEWLLKNIDRLKNDNNAKEYYLTDMVKIAFEEGFNVGTVEIDPREAVGINTKKELEVAERLL